MADELVRFTRVYDFIINKQYNTGYVNVDYQLNTNEIVIPASELDSSYFEDLATVSKYYNVIYSLDFYNAQPQIKQTISNVVKSKKTRVNRKIKIKRKAKTSPTSSKVATLDNASSAFPQKCSITYINTLRSKWKSLMGSKFKSTVYDGTTICSFQILCDIINNQQGDSTMTPLILRRKLSDIYGNLDVDEIKQLLTLFSYDGKIEFSRQIKTKSVPLGRLPLLETYYLSLPDILILSREYKLPLVIITSGKFKSVSNSIILTNNVSLEPSFDLPTNMDFYIVKQSGVKRNQPFAYELFSYYDDSIRLNTTMFKKKFIDYLTLVLDTMPTIPKVPLITPMIH